MKGAARQFVVLATTAALLLVLTLATARAQPKPLEDLGSPSETANPVEFLVAAAKKAYSENRFQDAATIYSRLIRVVENERSFFFARGMAYEMLNQPAKASADYRKTLEVDPVHFLAMENLAQIYENSGARLLEAIQLYKKAFELDPRPESKINLAFNLAVLERRLEPQDSSAVGCWNLGNSQVQKGNLKDAILFYSKAIGHDPRMFQAYYSRGLLRSRVGDLSGAIEDFDQAILYSPSLRGCLVARGVAHELQGDHEKAKKDFERAVTGDPRDPTAYYHLGTILEEEGDLKGALRSYISATRLKPKPDLTGLIRQRIATIFVSDKVDMKSILRSEPFGSDLW